MGTEEEEDEDEEDEEQSPKSVEEWIIDFNNKKNSHTNSQEWQKAHYELNELYRHLEKDYNKKNRKIGRDAVLAPDNKAAEKRLLENKKIVSYYEEAMDELADAEDKLLEDWRAWERGRTVQEQRASPGASSNTFFSFTKVFSSYRNVFWSSWVGLDSD